MQITGTHINYYFICHRKLWLFANGINMEHTSDVVTEGRLVHETSYPQRAEKYEEVNIGGSVIDFYDPKEKVIHETKKSNKVEEAHIAQVKYYLYLLEQNGVEGASALLEYPQLRETREVELSDDDRKNIPQWLKEIRNITQREQIPDRIKKSFCKNCSYYDFCWSE